MTRPMNHLETERLILRPFTEQDAEALFAILSDRDVNTFLPMFPLKNLEEAKAYIKDKHAAVHAGETLLYYAICRKEAPAPIGYVHVSGNDSHDLRAEERILAQRFLHRSMPSRHRATETNRNPLYYGHP